MKMQKTKLRHRVLALALALMLCVSMLNLTAFATEGAVDSEQSPVPVGEVVTNPESESDPVTPPVVEPEPEIVDPVDPADEPTEEQPKTEEGANNAEPKVEEPAKKPVEPAGDAVSGVENDTTSTNKAVTKVVNKVRAGGNVGAQYAWPQQQCHHTVGSNSTLQLGTWHGERGKMLCVVCRQDIDCPQHKDSNTSASGEASAHDHHCDYCHIEMGWSSEVYSRSEPKCTQPGEIQYKCLFEIENPQYTCPYNRKTEAIPALGHTFDEQNRETEQKSSYVDACGTHTETSCTGHYLVCDRENCGAHSAIEEHTYGKWSDWANCAAPANEETLAGAQWQSRSQECTVCGHTQTEYRMTTPWTPINPTYAVSYNWNQPEGAVAPTDGLPGTKSYGEGITVTVEEAPEVTVEVDGITYKLTGWTTDVTVSEGAFTMPGNPVTLNGVWEKVTAKYTVKHVDEATGEELCAPETKTGLVGARIFAKNEQRTFEGYEWVPNLYANILLVRDGVNELTLYYRAKQAPNIEISKTANKTEVPVGETVHFTITVKNTGSKGADVIINDILPDGLEGVGIVDSRATIQAKGSVTFNVEAKVTKLGEIVNTATATWTDDEETHDAAGTATVIGTDNGKGITVEKVYPADAPRVVKVGNIVTWNIRVTNISNVTKTVTLTDTLVWGDQTQQITLAAGKDQIIPVYYTVQETDKGKTLTNYVVAETDKPNEKVDDTATGPLVDNGSGITIVKTRTTNEKVKVGEEIRWTITVTNESNVSKTVTLTDEMVWGIETKEVKLEPGETKTVDASYVTKNEDVGKTLFNTVVGKTDDDEKVEGKDEGTKVTGYTVTYDWSGLPENHGQTLPTEPDHKADDSVNVDAKYTNGTEVTIAGKTYVFSGWSTTDATVEDGKFIMPAKDVTITGTWTEKTTPTGSVTPPSTPRTLTVNKLWVGDEDAGVRPDSIQVQLYLSGAAYGSPVTLSAANGWSFTWSDLPAAGTPTVEELNIPEGYEASTSISGSNVTITNTYTDEEIKDPDVPLGPGPGEPTPTPTPAPSEKPTPGPSATPDPDEDIEDPDVPLGPGPEDPGDPDEEIPDENVPLGTPKPVEPSEPDDGEEIPDEEVPMANTPKTGDDSGVWMTLALISAAGLVFLGISRRKKGENVR